jgi:hypothetical protein
MKMLILTNRCITLVFLLICVVLLSLVWWLLLWWAKFYALGALYFFISLWSSCKLWDWFQPPISQMLNCVLLSNYLQEVLVGQSPQVICVLHGNQTNFLLIFFSPPPNAKFRTDSILRSWPYPSLQLLILIDSNLSNPAFVAYTLLRRIKSCEWCQFHYIVQSFVCCLFSLQFVMKRNLTVKPRPACKVTDDES